MVKGSEDTTKRAGYWSTFLLGAAFGGAFGILADIVYLLLEDLRSWEILLAMPIGATVLSGLGGIGGTLLEKVLLRIGVTNRPFLRMIISFVIIAIVIVVIPGFLVIRSQALVWRQYFLGAAIGCGFGLAIAIVSYQIDKMRQRVSRLEMENEYLTEIAAKDQQLQETTKNLMIAEERNRMARELHDSISQGIHGILYSVHSLRKHLNATDEKTAQMVDYLQNTAEATLSELRAMIMELKPAIMEEHGLIEAIRLQSELFARRQQMTLDLNLGEAKGLSPEQEMAVYRIVQEALANIQRHSKAKGLRLMLITELSGDVVLEIVDNGKGFDLREIRRGNGLENMAARCRENGGEFRIESEPGQGTGIIVRFKS